MSINFAAASTAGLNNPGTEIITLVKDESGNFINPPSYDKIRAYLRSGEVPMLFVTAEGGETGSLYQFDEYSETENKIRFSNSANAIEFCAGCETPDVVEISSGGGFEYDFIITTTDGVTYTLVTGTYYSIMAKLGNQPIMGKTIINIDGGSQRIDADFIYVTYINNKLTATGFNGETVTSFVINPDNTVIPVE